MSQGVSPLTAAGMNFPLATQTTFGGPLSHYGLTNRNTTATNNNTNTNASGSWGGPSSIAEKNFQASANAAAASSNNTTSNASLLQTQSLALPHAASLVTSTPVPSGVVVATATLGSLTVICSPFGPKQTLLFRQGQCSQSTVSLPDSPTCITLFPLPLISSSSSSSSIPDGAAFQNVEQQQNSSSLGFNLCCAVGTSSGNVYIFDIVSRSGLPRDMTVSSIPTCVNERSLREAVDGSFSPATHKTDCAITDLAGSYSNGIQMSVLAVATPVTGVLFVRISKSPDGREILVHRVTAAVNSGSTLGQQQDDSASFVPSLQTKVVAVRAIENSKNNNITNQNDSRSFVDENSSVSIFRRSSILTFAVCYDDGCVQMIDLRLYITAVTANEPQITPLVAQILGPRDTSRSASIVTGDVYVSNDRDVTSYSIEEGGAVLLQHVPHNSSNNNNGGSSNSYNNNNNNANDNNNQSQTPNTNTSSQFQASTSTTNFNNNSGGNNNNNNRITVPRLNSLSCLTSSQAVASSRNSLLLLSASNTNNNNTNSGSNKSNNNTRYNTQNLMTLPFVINDLSVLKANSAFSGEQISRLLAGSSDSVQNYAPVGTTVAFVAADRNVSLVYVPL